MVEFETINAEETKFGNNNFIEVAHKKAITEEGEREFISVSRGFFTPDGGKRYNKSVTIPDEALVFVADKLKELASGRPAPAVEESPAELAESSAEEAPEEA